MSQAALRRKRFKLPSEARSCEECAFYLSLARWCGLHKRRVANPFTKNCEVEPVDGTHPEGEELLALT